jgi:hypothetical protein
MGVRLPFEQDVLLLLICEDGCGVVAEDFPRNGCQFAVDRELNAAISLEKLASSSAP